VLHRRGGSRLGDAWPALVLVALGLLAIAAGAAGGELNETLANGSAL
jgi:hypothetical protein